MADQHPSNAPDTTRPEMAEETTGAAILSDANMAAPSGGGSAFQGASAAALPGSSVRAAGGTSPNSPIDVPTPAATEEGDAAREAALQGISVAPPAPGHESR